MRNLIHSSRHSHEIERKTKKKKKKKSPAIISALLFLLLPALLFSKSQAAPMPEYEAGMRRILWPAASAQRSYITYDVLKRDKVPCDLPGTSYYSCHGSGEPRANPYVRGCSIIAGCRDGSP